MVATGLSAVRNQVLSVEFPFHRLPGKHPMHAAVLVDADRPLRSLALFAALAFVTGFLAYLAVTGWGMYRIVKAEIAAAPPSAGQAVERPASAAGSASGEWNLPKSI